VCVRFAYRQKTAPPCGFRGTLQVSWVSELPDSSRSSDRMPETGAARTQAGSL
jgi:hypothetical protein